MGEVRHDNKINEMELLKENALRLARDHKQTCENPECNISLHLVDVLLGKAGIKLTKKERSELV